MTMTDADKLTRLNVNTMAVLDAVDGLSPDAALSALGAAVSIWILRCPPDTRAEILEAFVSTVRATALLPGLISI